MLKQIIAMIWFELVWVVYLTVWRGTDITSWNNFWQETIIVSAIAIGLWIVVRRGAKAISR